MARIDFAGGPGGPVVQEAKKTTKESFTLVAFERKNGHSGRSELQREKLARVSCLEPCIPEA